MSFTFADFAVAFRFLRDSAKLSAGVQSCYFVILTEFHLAGFPEELWLSTRNLQEMAGLKSVSATYEARNVLKNHKLIDFKASKSGTVYRLGTEHLPNTLPNTYRTPTEHLPNTQQNTNGCVCYAQNAGASINTRDDGNAAPLPPSPAPLSSIPPTTLAINPTNQSPAISGKADDGMTIEGIWRKMTGKALEKPQDCSELRALEKAHGREIIKVALAEHIRCKGRSFAYFKACLNSTLARLKGGEGNGRKAIEADKQNGARKFEKPDYSNYPFYKGDN